jgi:N-acetylglucosamine kinase-like BadF-type ATPase
VKVVVGVDGGGSKTHCAVCDTSGELLGFGRSGASNWETVGVEGTRAALAAALDAALSHAPVSGKQVEAAVFGLGGVDWPSDVGRLEPIIKTLELAGQHLILNDAFIALRAGTDEAAGVAIVAGSGTTVVGRNRHGEIYRTLGQGPPRFDDFGSAPDVAERAVQAVARAFTGRGPETVLSARLCDLTGAVSVAALLEGLTRGSIEVPEMTAAIVLNEAEAGDPAAREIVLDAGRALGGSAAVAIGRLHLRAETFDVVLAGGLFRGLTETLWGAIYEPVRSLAPGATLVRLEAPPVVGACLLGLEQIGEVVAPETRCLLAEACSAEVAIGV